MVWEKAILSNRTDIRNEMSKSTVCYIAFSYLHIKNMTDMQPYGIFKILNWERRRKYNTIRKLTEHVHGTKCFMYVFSLNCGHILNIILISAHVETKGQRGCLAQSTSLRSSRI